MEIILTINFIISLAIIYHLYDVKSDTKSIKIDIKNQKKNNIDLLDLSSKIIDLNHEVLKTKQEIENIKKQT
jgi:hypothetical protein